METKFINKNKYYLIMGFLALFLVLFNEYDKRNRDTINVVVETNISNTTSKSKKEKDVKIFVYNPDLNQIELKDIKMIKEKELIGDYVTEVIKNSSFLNENMKFLSAYVLNIDDKNTMMIKLNSSFLDLKDDERLFEGFVDSLKKTMLELNPKIENIQIQIDGDKNIQ